TWNHLACHVKAGQDLAAHLYDGADMGAGTARNVSGGWHDAGDYRKYVSFTQEPLWDLMHAAEWYPCAFGDATNIPESGNGVPDKTYSDANHNSASLPDSGHQPTISNYFETGASSMCQRALISYALAPGATAAVVTAIKTSSANGATNGPVNNYLSDLYRAFM